MSSSDVQPTNGHVHADNTTLCDVETTSSNPIEPSDRPEHEVSEQVRSAQPEAPVLGDSPAGQSPVKPKPLASPSKRPTPTALATTKSASGPPTPQVKKVPYFLISDMLRPFTHAFRHIADFKLGQVWYGRHQGCSTSNLHFCQAFHDPSSLFYPEDCTPVQPHCAEEIHLCTFFEDNHATQAVNWHPFRSGSDT